MTKWWYFFMGYITHALIITSIQDFFLGKEKYLKIVEETWTDNGYLFYLFLFVALLVTGIFSDKMEKKNKRLKKELEILKLIKRYAQDSRKGACTIKIGEKDGLQQTDK